MRCIVYVGYTKGIILGVMHFSASEEMRADDFGASGVFTIIWKDNSEIIRSCPSKSAIFEETTPKIILLKK